MLAVDRPGHGLADPFDLPRHRPAGPRRANVPAQRHERTSNSRPSTWSPTWLGACLSVAFAIDAPRRVSRLALVGAPFGVARRPPLIMLPARSSRSSRERLARYLFERDAGTKTGSTGARSSLKHPERVDDLHARRRRRELPTERRKPGVGLLTCVADWRRLSATRREMILGDRWRALGGGCRRFFARPSTTPEASPEDGRGQPRRLESGPWPRSSSPVQATTRGSMTRRPS